jgi:hypothetical protein
VLRRYSDAWFAAGARRKAGVVTARYPRRRRRLMPVRYCHGTFTLEGRRLRLPVARGCPPLWVRLDRDVPYPAGQVRSVTLLNAGRRLFAEVTAEVPVTCYPAGQEPDPRRVAGVDPGVIHPFAVAGPDRRGPYIARRREQTEAPAPLPHRDTQAHPRRPVHNRRTFASLRARHSVTTPGGYDTPETRPIRPATTASPTGANVT